MLPKDRRLARGALVIVSSSPSLFIKMDVCISWMLQVRWPLSSAVQSPILFHQRQDVWRRVLGGEEGLKDFVLK